MHKVALKKPTFAQNTANVFGVLGYISLLIEWVWLACIVAYPVVKDGRLDWLMPTSNPESVTMFAPAPPSAAAMIIGIVVTILCLGVVLYSLYTLPRSIGKVGAKITHAAADSVLPVLTHRRKITKKLRRKLTLRTITTIKFLLLIAPVLIVFIVPSFSALSKDIVTFTTAFLAAWAFVYFLVQLAITQIAKLSPDHIW